MITHPAPRRLNRPLTRPLPIPSYHSISKVPLIVLGLKHFFSLLLVEQYVRYFTLVSKETLNLEARKKPNSLGHSLTSHICARITSASNCPFVRFTFGARLAFLIEIPSRRSSQLSRPPKTATQFFFSVLPVCI